jgi:hypothetical protein
MKSKTNHLLYMKKKPFEILYQNHFYSSQKGEQIHIFPLFCTTV